MIANERYMEILDRLKRDGVVKTQQLVEHFGVSRETIRRDLEHLEEQGLVRRVYGGATHTAGNRGTEPPYTSRETVNPEEKRAIGRAAAELIKDGETVILDVGTTVLEVARHLRRHKDLTVVTNSMRAAHELVSLPSLRVYTLGGEFRDGEFSTSGFMAEAGLRDFYVDKAVVGAGGLTSENGVSDYHEPEARLRRTMAEHAKEVIVVADHSKIGVVAFVNCIPIRMIDVCVTDAAVSDETARQFIAKGIEFVRAGDEGRRSA